MPNLSNLVQKYSHSTTQESNLEKGKIWLYTTATHQGARFIQNIHWRPHGHGKAIVEIWGAAGSGSKMSCCGLGLPGNPPAYAKSTVCLDESSWICASLGLSCGNASTLCYRGISESTQLTICSPSGTLPTLTPTCLCMCAEGGQAGLSLCTCNVSALGKFAGCTMFVTEINDGCGYICNLGTNISTHIPQAYGGLDVNCPGGISKTFVGSCDMGAAGWPCVLSYVRTAAGIWGPEPQTITHSYVINGWTAGGHDGFRNYIANVMQMQQHPVTAEPFYTCYSNSNYCGCYEDQGCGAFHSHGIPGYGGIPCAGVCDHGTKGGHGAMRIRFIRDSDFNCKIDVNKSYDDSYVKDTTVQF